jgi:DNA-binding PucR family transcriptional regulator
MDHDREKGTQYFETFREYILNERDIPKTAEKLIIHRTTLLYRLKKLQALTNVDPEDPWKRLHYMLSLWFLDREANQKPTHEE